MACYILEFSWEFQLVPLSSFRWMADTYWLEYSRKEQAAFFSSSWENHLHRSTGERVRVKGRLGEGASKQSLVPKTMRTCVINLLDE